jgi:hypothetical protein
MPWFKIKWNAGYGESTDFIEVEDQAAADQAAYERWREEAESNSDYSAEGPLDDPTKDEDHPDFDWDAEDEADPS